MTNLSTRKLPAISEALNNYHKTDNLLIEEQEVDLGVDFIYNESQFWNVINDNAKMDQYKWGQEFSFYESIITEWIPRMPGVIYTPKGNVLRKLAQNEIISKTQRSVIYSPVGKGMKVMGGIGTFKCAPQQEYRMVAITISGNCSGAIPLLISNNLWYQYGLREGVVLEDSHFQWIKMTENWSSKFRSSMDLIRGCLIVKSDELHLKKKWDSSDPKIVATGAHPYTILEYNRNGVPYYDFMYFSKNEQWDKDRVTAWLENYRKDKNRNGRYIFEPDPNEIIYQADYISPSDYLNRGMEDLKIMNARIEEILKNESPGLFDAIYQFLCTNIANEDDLVRISKQNLINIPPIRWRGRNSLLNSIKSFLDLIIDQKKVVSLYDLLQTDYPQEFIVDQ